MPGGGERCSRQRRQIGILGADIGIGGWDIMKGAQRLAHGS